MPRADLTPDEVTFLWVGMRMWNGPATMTDRLARVLWYESADDFDADWDRLRTAIREGESLEPVDWHRALAGVEVAFASLTLGAGGDWAIVTGFDDAASLIMLRDIQKKLAWVRPWPEPFARPGHHLG